MWPQLLKHMLPITYRLFDMLAICLFLARLVVCQAPAVDAFGEASRG